MESQKRQSEKLLKDGERPVCFTAGLASVKSVKRRGRGGSKHPQEYIYHFSLDAGQAIQVKLPSSVARAISGEVLGKEAAQ